MRLAGGYNLKSKVFFSHFIFHKTNRASHENFILSLSLCLDNEGVNFVKKIKNFKIHPTKRVWLYSPYTPRVIHTRLPRVKKKKKAVRENWHYVGFFDKGQKREREKRRVCGFFNKRVICATVIYNTHTCGRTLINTICIW